MFSHIFLTNSESFGKSKFGFTENKRVGSGWFGVAGEPADCNRLKPKGAALERPVHRMIE